ncbi:MAG: hypothetical protein OEY66_10995 [Gammaproteobacteria bacterium]|nr:hypothetical protein [Gammaproteobacteria bacterium]
MKKIQMLVMLFISVITQPVTAAYIDSVVENGNTFTPFPSGVDYETSIGVTRFQVEFNNLNSVQINLDNEFMYQDDIGMLIVNNTGTGWSGFNFELIGVGFFGPLSLTPQTGIFSEWLSSGSDPYTGLNTEAYVGFDPFEYVQFSVSGKIDTTFVQQYSLIITPTTVPVPAAVWLFGSGLLGLISVARRKI